MHNSHQYTESVLRIFVVKILLLGLITAQPLVLGGAFVFCLINQVYSNKAWLCFIQTVNCFIKKGCHLRPDCHTRSITEMTLKTLCKYFICCLLPQCFPTTHGNWKLTNTFEENGFFLLPCFWLDRYYFLAGLNTVAYTSIR